MSLHSEYDEPVEDVVAMTTMDYRYLQRLLADAASS